MRVNRKEIKLSLGAAVGGGIVLAVIGFAWAEMGYGQCRSENG